MVTVRRIAALAAALLCAFTALGEATTVSRERTAAPPLAPGVEYERVVEGRVARLVSYRDALGYPVTDVHLSPGGERFTVLGGREGDVIWVVDGEARFEVGDEVRVELERSAIGLRPAGGRDGVQRRVRAGNVPLPEESPEPSTVPWGTPPVVTSVTPPAGPAVAGEPLEVTLSGFEFGTVPGRGGVFFQGLFEHVPAEILEWSETRIRALVPSPGLFGRPQIFSGSVKVWTEGGGWSDRSEWTGGAQYRVQFQHAGDVWSEGQLPVGYRLNPAGFPWPEWMTAALVQRATVAWRNLRHSFADFRYDGLTGLPAVRAKDSTNVIGWTEPWPHSPGWIAVTWSAIDAETGRRLESDVEINGEVAWSVADVGDPGAYDFLTMLTHEFGHWLRLGHVVEADHVMHAFQARGEHRRTLAVGDREGGTWTYPTFGRVFASGDTIVSRGATLDTLVLTVEVADRRGRPLTGLSAARVFAVAAPLESPEAPLRPAGEVLFGDQRLTADGTTDESGRTRIVVPFESGEGAVRFTVMADGRALRDRPVVYFSGGPSRTSAITLRAPSPNPAALGPVRARLELARPVARLRARVLDARGRVVAELHDGPAPAGARELVWHTGTAEPRPPSGLYFLEVRGAGERQARKIVLLGG